MKKLMTKLMTAKKIYKGISVFAAVLCIIFAAVFGYTAVAKAVGEPLPMIFGWGNAVVLSGSMEPELPVGALVIIQKQDSYSAGDVVTYQEENGTLVTHRLMSVKNGVAVTKGDANNTEDSPILLKQIRGKVQAVWQGAGNVMLWLKSPICILLLLLVGGLLIFIPNSLIKRKVR